MISFFTSLFSGAQTYIVIAVVVIVLALGGYAYTEHLRNAALSASVSSLTVANQTANATIQKLQTDAQTVADASTTANVTISAATTAETTQAAVIKARKPQPGVDTAVNGLFGQISGASK